MSLKLKFTSAFAGTLAFVFTMVVADGSGAAAQNRTPQRVEQITPQAPAAPSAPDNLLSGSYPAPSAAELRAPADTRLPAPIQSATEPNAGETATAPAVAHASLAGAMAGNSADLSRELECLAGAIYFEAKSESLEGQLAVGRVVINRAKSGRFPASYCGVVYQRSQFSFIHGGAMPPINRASRNWRQAVAIARIADANSYPSAAEGALFFHATSVSPNWRLTRVARVDNHVFYR